MLRCPACSQPTADTSRFCPGCGASLDVSSTPTGTAPRPAARTPPPGTPSPGSRPPTASSGGSRPASATSGHGRFVPGTLVADRYRVVGLLGKGGMGEVYRADDLKLGQPVALKFLPEALQDDAERLERFYNEVRIARQITHPAVCRVHDIGEHEGQALLTMEYVDGEDLASLLRRIGRVPKDKALDVAQQLCAGLAAAHERGVLHRDLKPPNIMLDGRGKVRITDFGLAGLADSLVGDDVRSGTPAYMSPEQLEGREVTVRSDVYALGLVLYELFTGKKAVEGRTLAEVSRKHREEAPPSPSSLVPDLDPGVERVILRCIEKDPARRPSSSLAVAAALPGGDVLAAALAAGLTPSPEMVAEAGTAECLRPAVAWAGLAVGFAGLALVPLLSRDFQLFRYVPFEKPPAVLEDRARDIVRKLGYAEPPADSGSGFHVDLDYIQHVTEKDRSPGRWKGLETGQPPVVQFWYRQSPRPLLSTSSSGRVSPGNPPLTVSGMIDIWLDTRGRLVEFYAVPPQVESGGARAPLEWRALFAEAHLDQARFQAVEPQWTPPFYCDARAAWEGVYPDRPEIPIRVEAAAYRGRPVSFQIVAPWTRPERMRPFRWASGHMAGFTLGAVVSLAVILASALLAHRNVRLGRGDPRGASRVAGYVLAVGTAARLLVAHHVADFGGEMASSIRGLGLVLVIVGMIWLFYLALEPYVRRLWPHALISWASLLEGRLLDPRVGRALLFGTAGGAVTVALAQAMEILSTRLGKPISLLWWGDLDMLLGARHAASALLDGQIVAMSLAMGLLVLLLLFRLLLRREWLAALAVIALFGLRNALFSEAPLWQSLPLAMLFWAVPTLVLLRYGLLACMVGAWVAESLETLPITSDLTSWAGSTTVLVLVFWAGVALYGFRVCLAGRPALKGELLPD